METKKGIPVSPGVSIGEAYLVGQERFRVRKRTVRRSRVLAEIKRLDKALEKTVEELDGEILRLGEELYIARQVLESHRAIVADPHLRDEVSQTIENKKYTAEYALVDVLSAYYKRFEAMKSEYISDRANDLLDVERKVLRQLFGRKQRRTKAGAGHIIVGHTLTPSEAAALDRSTVGGFAIDVGGRTSHIAIIARAMRMPAVVGLENVSEMISTGDTVIIDGYTGVVITDPDEETLEEYRWKASVSEDFYARLQTEVRLPSETLDGYRISIAANIEFPDEIHSALEWGATGVGLYRTEFLYADKKAPDEERHYRSYREAVEDLQGRYLVIRTLDAGADKFHDEAIGRTEPNPFLGCRSIRLCLEHPEIFRDQIRAVLRVSSLGPVRILLPMVSNVGELRSAKALIREVEDELDREGVEFERDIPLGIMVEVPSAALLSDYLAREVDFFSIGTNDLVQYCLAVDRVNERIAHLYQPAHPAILRLVVQVIEAARDRSIEVSICGEMCSEPIYTILLLGLGLRSFSVSPIAIPTVKRILRKVTMRDAVEVAQRCLEFETAEEGQEYLETRLKSLLPELF